MSSKSKIQSDHVPRIKLVIVGDGACGKTSVLHVFKYGTFSRAHIPTVFDNYVHTVQVDGKSVELALWDTAGQEEYDRIRIHSYPGANVVLISFAIDTKDSLENVTSEWIEEVNKECPGVPIILVGLKKDLRPQDARRNDDTFVHPREAEIVASNIGARSYIECSALTGEGVQKVFDIAVRAGLIQKQKEDTGCCIIL
ncbi:GTP-binding protein rho2 [Umbelopsis sp. AD052]|nr:GTP-binding protein rho2 [Umbelopsis sp. AD052]